VERIQLEEQKQADLAAQQKRDDFLKWVLQNFDKLNDDQHNMVAALKHFEVSDWVSDFEIRQR